MVTRLTVPCGDAALTRLIKRLSKEQGRQVEEEGDTVRIGGGRWGWRRDGWTVDSDILDHARTILADRRKKEEQATDVMLALYTLNRRAKRCRDLAQSYYQQDQHGFAGEHKREKEIIYDLKNQALAHLVLDGRLIVTGYHVFDGGNWAELLEGDGYRFHRPAPPTPPWLPLPVEGEIEARPKGKREPTLVTAYSVVEAYLMDKPYLDVYTWPRQYQRFRHDYYDDEEGFENDWENNFKDHR